MQQEIDQVYTIDEVKEILKIHNMPHSHGFVYKHLRQGTLELNYYGIMSFREMYRSKELPQPGRPRKY